MSEWMGRVAAALTTIDEFLLDLAATVCNFIEEWGRISRKTLCFCAILIRLVCVGSIVFDGIRFDPHHIFLDLGTGVCCLFLIAMETFITHRMKQSTENGTRSLDQFIMGRWRKSLLIWYVLSLIPPAHGVTIKLFIIMGLVWLYIYGSSGRDGLRFKKQVRLLVPARNVA